MSEYVSLLGLAVSAVAGVIVSFSKTYLDENKNKKEETEIKFETDRLIELIGKSDSKKDDDILKLMLKNVAEMREYYILNKQQARNAFSAALWISVSGFVLFAAGIIYHIVAGTNDSVLIYTGISGTVVEIISGLFFWLYSQALKQLNLFHTSLRNTEKFLTAIKLVEDVSEKSRDLIYAYIIRSIFEENANEKLDPVACVVGRGFTSVKGEAKEVRESKELRETEEKSA